MKKIIKSDEIINIPSEVAICPYCDGKLACSANSWIQEKDGTWLADELDLDCENEMLNDDIHNDMPYIYWLPVAEKVKAWVNKTYEFWLRDEAKALRKWNKALLDWN